MPGGGSEILNNDVKQVISRFNPKDTVEKWTDVHVAAHKIGFKTTATMMYGHVEKDEIQVLVEARRFNEARRKLIHWQEEQAEPWGCTQCQSDVPSGHARCGNCGAKRTF